MNRHTGHGQAGEGAVKAGDAAAGRWKGLGMVDFADEEDTDTPHTGGPPHRLNYPTPSPLSSLSIRRQRISLSSLSLPSLCLGPSPPLYMHPSQAIVVTPDALSSLLPDSHDQSTHPESRAQIEFMYCYAYHRAPPSRA